MNFILDVNFTLTVALYSFYDVYYESKNNTYDYHGNNREVETDIFLFNPDITGKPSKPFE